MIWRRAWFAWLACAIVLGAVATSPIDAQTRQLKVLVLYGTPASAPVQRAASALIRQRLARPLGHRVTLYEEFVDADTLFAPPGASRTTTTARAETLRRYLASTYAHVTFDFILAVGWPALEFHQQYGRALFGRTPVIACMVPSEMAERLPRDSIVTIVNDSIDLKGTLDLALILQPATRHVVVVGGASPFDTSLLKRAAAIQHFFEPRVDFTVLAGQPFNVLQRRVAALAPHSIILYLSMFADSSGNRYATSDVGDALTSAANAPVYVWTNGIVGRGAVGGRLTIGDSSVARAIRIAHRLIAGVAPESLPRRSRTPIIPVVDWRQLHRWRIDETRVPAGTRVVYRPVPAWKRYKLQLAALIAILIAQTAVIGALVVQHVQRRRAESTRDAAMDDLRVSREEIHQLVGRLIATQEAERARIGRELHDDVNKRLAALCIALRRFRQRLPAHPSTLAKEAEQLQDRATTLTQDVRRLSHQLHSSVLQHAGLEAALRALGAEFTQSYGIELDMMFEGSVDDVSSDVALGLYRVMQEALRNTATHARARHVRAAVTRYDGAIEMSIIDDGHGFDMNAPRPRASLGLVSIEERVSMLGGSSRVIAHPGDGTQINIRLPASAIAHVPAPSTEP